MTASSTSIQVDSISRGLPLDRADSSGFGASGWLAGLFLLLVVAGGLAIVRRKRPGLIGRVLVKGRDDKLARVASQALTPHASVHCVRWGGEELLLGCTTQQVTVLARRPCSSEDGERA